MKKLIIILFACAISFAHAQDTTKTPNINAMSVDMWQRFQADVDKIGLERNYWYNVAKSLRDTINQLRNPNTPDIGVNIHPFTNSAYSDLPGIVRDVKALGLNAVRVDLHPNGSGLIANSTLYNSFLQAFAGSGLRIRPMVSLSSYLGQSYTSTVADGQVFATNYPYDQYEMHNEADNLSILSGDGTKITDYDSALISKYEIAMKAFAEGIHNVNPKAKIIVDIAWVHFAFATEMIRYGVPVDIYSQHFYTNQQKAYTGVPIEQRVKLLFPNQQIIFNEVGLTPQADGTLKSTDFAIFKDLLTRFKPFGFFINELYNEPSRGLVEGNYGLYSKPGVPVQGLVDIVKAVINN